jgi:hypothetical protein
MSQKDHAGTPLIEDLNIKLRAKAENDPRKLQSSNKNAMG